MTNSINKKITLNHGSGGRQMHEFINHEILKEINNPILNKMDDSAILENINSSKLAMTTDSYVVSPIFFPGGDIGRLAVSGTVNDLATCGARPYALSLAFILEEGIELKTLRKVIKSIAKTANEANVKIVTGDTKVVEKGKGDQIYINTCGIGYIDNSINEEISTYSAKVGDKVIATGPLGNHEVAMMKARNMFEFELNIVSDVAPLNKQIEKILSISSQGIHVIKDPTRGGAASALYEIAEHSNCTIMIDENSLPIDPQVSSICELTGLDPIYFANEGKYLIVCHEDRINDIIEIFGNKAQVIGEVLTKDDANLLMKTTFGGLRKVGMLETTQLPRIC